MKAERPPPLLNETLRAPFFLLLSGRPRRPRATLTGLYWSWSRASCGSSAHPDPDPKQKHHSYHDDQTNEAYQLAVPAIIGISGCLPGCDGLVRGRRIDGFNRPGRRNIGVGSHGSLLTRAR